MPISLIRFLTFWLHDHAWRIQCSWVGKHLWNNLTFVGAVWSFNLAKIRIFKPSNLSNKEAWIINLWQVDFQKQLNCFDSCKETNKTRSHWLKFIYSEKAKTFWEISTVDLSYVVTVKSTVEILQNFVAFSEYMNFKQNCSQLWEWAGKSNWSIF